MESIDASAAKTRLRELLERVGRGETVQITLHGLPVARLVPESVHDSARAARAVERLESFHEDMPEAPLQEILDARHEGHEF